MDIQQWDAIKDQFNNAAIILGNGASIAFDNSRFHYKSLFDEAKKAKFITQDVQQIFTQFSTDDFEQILLSLWQAIQINKILSIDGQEIENAYVNVRSALINVVHHIHKSFQEWQTADDEFEAKLFRAATFLKNFHTVISLNYDCLLYWIIINGNKTYGNWFKDTFADKSESHANWKKLRNRYKAEGSTLVLYPHGNLSLAIDKNNATKKLVTKNTFTDLITHIANEWQKGKVVPLFVCEGSTQQKLSRIQSNSYLARVYSEIHQLNNYGEHIVIYGWSMSNQDKHILEALKQSRAKKIAISIHNNDRSFYTHAKKLISENFRLDDKHLIFFDANSPSCWIHNAK